MHKKQETLDALNADLTQKFRATAHKLREVAEELNRIAGCYDTMMATEHYKEGFLAHGLAEIADTLLMFHAIKLVAMNKARSLPIEEKYRQIRQAVKDLEFSEETQKRAEQLITDHKTKEAVEVLETERGMA